MLINAIEFPQSQPLFNSRDSVRKWVETLNIFTSFLNNFNKITCWLFLVSIKSELFTTNFTTTA